ncbi:hypothetical protein [Escherichia phage AV124]|nr:hypothetical protein [Escherichia phage AV124]
MNKYYFAFGMNQETKDGMSLGNYYVCIEAKHHYDARFEMFDARGSSWSFCYTEEEFAGQPEKYGLKSISLDEVRIR